ncbi:MAG: LCP family protein [Acidimicrobiales bacterium]
MASPSEAVGRAPRRWPRRLLIAANIFVAVCVLGVAATYGYFMWQYGQFPKVGGLAGIFKGNDDPGEPMNVLLVGSDTRATIDSSETKSFGSETDVAGQRSDTIIILHVNPRLERAAMLSIPRDLYVPIAGTTGTCQGSTHRCNRINTAFESTDPDEGVANLIKTIQENIGIDIGHYVQVDFVGFRSLVNAVDGVDVYIPSRARDKVTGLNIENPGCVRFNGEMSLAYVRSRHYEYFESGRWRTDPTSDFGRIQRQQDFSRRAMKRAIGKGARNPVVLHKLINTGRNNLKIDEGFAADEMLDLAKRFRSLEPGAVETFTLPTDRKFINGLDVQVLKAAEAQEAIDKFLGVGLDPGAVPDVSPSEVQVRVLNGSGKGGQASDTASALTGAGYNVVGAGDADTFKYTFTEIRYGSGQKDKALLLQSQVKGRTKIREDKTLRGLDVVLITGAEYAGIGSGAAAPAAPASSTPPPSTAPGPAPEPSGDTAADQC